MLDGDGNLIDEVQVIKALKPNYELSLEGLDAQDKVILMKLQNRVEKAVPASTIFSRP
jgi:hypothetical protein